MEKQPWGGALLKGRQICEGPDLGMEQRVGVSAAQIYATPTENKNTTWSQGDIAQPGKVCKGKATPGPEEGNRWQRTTQCEGGIEIISPAENIPQGLMGQKELKLGP